MSGAAQHRAPTGAFDEDVRIGVVVPVYRQHQFLGESVVSALDQGPGVGIVIVNDGCPDPETHQVGTELQRLFAPQVRYLRQENRGPSAARNAGIRFALDQWPNIEAILPLDADNRLGPSTLSLMAAKLDEDPGAAWCYPSLEVFGAEQWRWTPRQQFSAYLELIENQCDSGSLIRRGVFDQGHYFDESMRDGYEDWELFVRLVGQGRYGVAAGQVGFEYRKRAHSMLTQSSLQHEAIVGEIRRRHTDQYQAQNLTRLEHAEFPRFALIDRRAATAELTANVDAPSPCVPAADVLSAFGNDPTDPDPPFVPSILVVGDTSVFKHLDDLEMLPGLLLAMQAALREAPIVGLRLGRHPSAYGLGVEHGPRRRLGRVHAFAVRPGGLPAAMRITPARGPMITVRVGDRHWPAAGDRQRRWSPTRAARRLGAHFGHGRFRPVLREDPVSSRLREQHVDRLDTTLPWASPSKDQTADVFFVVPWIKLGGADLCVLQLAAAVARSGARAHLVVTEEASIETTPENLAPFSTITSVAHFTEASVRRSVLGLVLDSATVVLNSISQTCYDLGAATPVPLRARHVAYLHMVDRDPRGLPVGWPYVAANCEARIDEFLVVSQRLGDFVENLGVPRSKIRYSPNAPVIRPDHPQQVLEEKCSRHPSPEHPLRVLFAGRLDHQKGLERLVLAARSCRARRLPVDLTVMGKAVIEKGPMAFPRQVVRVIDPVLDPGELGRWYEWADVLLLPSRYEGVPLAMLDAMAFATVVIATDVGGVTEVLADGINGVVIDPDWPDPEVAAEIVNRFDALVADPRAFDEIRANAQGAALALDWSSAGAALVCEGA